MDLYALNSNTTTDLENLQTVIHNNAIAKKFWPVGSGTPAVTHPPDLILARAALITCEMAEFIEAYRSRAKTGGIPLTSEKIPPYTLEEEELADAIIRILDLSTALGYHSLFETVEAKMAYNADRPAMHGKSI